MLTEQIASCPEGVHIREGTLVLAVNGRRFPWGMITLEAMLLIC
jgi:hypothetical protein